MKILRFLCTIMMVFSLFARATIFASEPKTPPFRAEIYADSDKTAGTRVQTSFFDFRAATRISSNVSDESKTNFGTIFSTKALIPKTKSGFSFPLTAKAGNLSTGGAFSRLNNPTLSAGSSPFTTNSPPPPLLTASLPSYTGFSKPESYFFQADLSFPAFIQATANCLITPEAETPVVSAEVRSFLAKKQFSINLSAIAGQFSYEANSFNSWFSEQAYYNGGKHFCALTTLSTSLAPSKSKKKTSFTTSFTAGFYESPFGTLPVNLRGEINFKNQKFETFVSAFYNPQEGLITSSQKSIPSIIQAKTGFIVKKMITYTATPILIKTGFNIFSEYDFIHPEPPVTANLGFQFSDNLKTLSFSASLKMTIPMPPPSYLPDNPDFDSLSLQLKNQWNFKYVSPGAGINITFPKKGTNDESVQKFKISASLTGNTKSKISANAAFSFNLKNGEIENKKLTAIITGRLTLKNLTILGKLSTTIE